MSQPVYKNPAYSESERVEDLLSRMTVDEKLAQIAMGPDLDEMAHQIDDGTYPAEGYASSYSYKTETMDCLNKVQKYQMEHTRLGIPLLLHGESLHGFMCHGATVFPQATSLGASFDPELVGKIADVAGREAYIKGVRQTYAPNLDISRDPRWGRVEENYGEDPYLTGRMAAAYVTNLQKNHVASSPKHYLAHGTPESGINIGAVHMGEREVREVMLEPFAAAVQEGKAMSIMPAYSELDGVPIHANHWAMTELLRDELCFDGYTVSDFGAVSMLCHSHHVAETPEEAAEIALKAGIDHEAGRRYCCGDEFCQKVRDGKFDMAVLDEAVRRTLRIKFRLGMFEDPYSKPERIGELRSPESVALARRAAQETPVLLENNGILPLSEADPGKIALVGPLADYPMLGDYQAPNGESYSITVRKGLTERLGTERVIYAKGSHIAKTSESMLAAVKAAADESDLVICVLGDNSCFHGGKPWGDEEGGNVVTCGEGFDSDDLQLPPAQIAVLKTAAASGKPVILILECGRPYVLTDIRKYASAILWAGYTGEQGGYALCDLLFGDVSPSGRLPISLPRSSGAIPCYYNHKPTSRGYYHKPGSPENPGRDYIFADPRALYPFGYGLSYTSFVYSGLQVQPLDGANVRVSVTVTNTGHCASDETVLVFLRQHVCPVTPFVKRLRAFTRLSLNPGESKTAEFVLTAEDFSYIDEHMKKLVGRGKFTIMVGGREAETVL